MSEARSLVEDLTSVFQTWAKTGLTESFKRSSKTRPFEQKKDVDELIKIMRKNKSVDPPSSWNTRNRRWWSAVTSNKCSEMSQLLVEDSTLIRWKNPIDGWVSHHACLSLCFSFLPPVYAHLTLGTCALFVEQNQFVNLSSSV
nr:unnamed protein product [Spirometra erinaceieuropaei]